MRKIKILGLFILAIISAFSLPGQAQKVDAISTLKRQEVRLYQAGKYTEAIAVAHKVLELSEQKFGPNHPNVGTVLNNLAELYRLQGRYAEAEPLYKRTITIIEKALGPDHPNVGRTLNNLALLYSTQGRYAEAEPLYKRSLSIYEKALDPDHPNVGTGLNNLALLYADQGRYAEAEPLYKRSLSIREKALGPDHPDVGQSLNNLALLYADQGRYAEAEPLYKRSLSIREKALGPDHPDVGGTLNSLALLYAGQGRYAEAEPLYKRSLSIREKTLGPDHPDVGGTLNSLALLYADQGRYAEAEPLFKRDLAIIEKALGPDHSNVGTTLNNLATLYERQGRYADAELLHKRSLSIREKALGLDHPNVGQSLNNLAFLYRAQGRYAEAEPLFKRDLAIIEKALGPDHPNVSIVLNNLAWLYYAQNDWETATDYFRRGLHLIAKRTQRGTQTSGQNITGQETVEAKRASYAFALSIKSAHRLAQKNTALAQELASDTFQYAQWALSSDTAASLAKMAARHATGNSQLAALVRKRQDLVNEWQQRDAFRTAAASQQPDRRNRHQEAQNTARLSDIEKLIANIDQRLDQDFPDYAEFANPVPLTIAKTQHHLRANEALILFLSTPEFEQTPSETFIWVVTKTASKWVRSDLTQQALTDHVDALRCGLDYDGAWKGTRCFDLLDILYTDEDRANGKSLPFDLKRVHTLYEALFSKIADLIKGKDWLVVKSGALTQLPLQALVTAFPKDAVTEQQQRQIARIGIEFKMLTAKQLKSASLSEGDGAFVVNVVLEGPAAAAGVKPGDIIVAVGEQRLTTHFNLANAVRNEKPGAHVAVRLIRNSKLMTLYVTLGSATITEWVPYYLNAENAPQIQWLAKSHAVTVLPSVSSLTSLRQHAMQSRAPKPFIGFGNPLLDGPDGRYAERAKQAREFKICSERKATWQELASWLGLRNAIDTSRISSGRITPAMIRRQTPLPETADELCEVANDTGATADDVYLGARATEESLKKLSADGKLAQYRVLHFATHGVLAEEITDTSEPGLILTPPEPGKSAQTAPGDNGYLSASEIAGLKLNADWVILSACNTAGGQSQNSEALSGMAKAFIYAGARSLLVSHWYVDSQATVSLITKVFAELRRDPKISRAAALRKAMLALIKDDKRTWHPEYWAPFVVVGEGAG